MRLIYAMTCLIDSYSSHSAYTLLLAHGAGAGADSDFMRWIKTALEQRGIQVIRFNFPYMRQILREGKRRPPDRMPVLQQSFTEAIASLNCEQLWIGGKSMGGRVATLLSEHPQVIGTLALGYPFHPPGKPDKLRVQHLQNMGKPCLILQGERDSFGKRHEVEGYSLPDTVMLHWLADGDHSFKPRKVSGITQMDNINRAAEVIAKAIKQQAAATG
jgi:hypothetical protein